MEVLSTGEKIKRARVYKGITLKDICGDKISVSKMSCIENDKIKAEPWVLELVAYKLGTTVEYLTKDIKTQIQDNIDELEKKSFSESIESELKYNLEYAMEHKEYNLAFRIMHLLFTGYIETKRTGNLEEANSQYYDVCEKCSSPKCSVIYYNDIAKFFFASREYVQASSYYENAISIMKENEGFSTDDIAYARYNSLKCCCVMKSYDEIVRNKEEMISKSHKITDDSLKAGIYSMIAIAELWCKNENRSLEYQGKAMELYGGDKEKIYARIRYSNVLVDINSLEKALSYMEETIDICRDSFKDILGEALIAEIEILYKNGIFAKAEVRCNEVIDFAISKDDARIMEKGYYYKAKILKKKGSDLEAEMCMNISLDAFMKFCTKKDLCERYMEMGNMYYELGEVRDALRYFNLSFNLKKII